MMKMYPLFLSDFN